jgi:hypothetical protein
MDGVPEKEEEEGREPIRLNSCQQLSNAPRPLGELPSPVSGDSVRGRGIDEHLAGELVHGTFMYLAFNWAHMMKQAKPEAYAWALLKQRVATELMMLGRELC